jgi:hypothetical protein
MKAAKGAGYELVRVEIDPKTAKITLVIHESGGTEIEKEINPLDDAPGLEPTRRRKNKTRWPTS